MKKHILGLTLFSFIVGTTAFIYAAFFRFVPDVTVAETPLSAPMYSAEKTSCWKMKRKTKADSIKVNIAVFNLQSRKFHWEIIASRNDAIIALHFFSKDGKVTRYVNTEMVNARLTQDGVLKFNNTYQWINELKSLDNLYVIAEYESEISRHPNFDAAKATAVTLDHGELRGIQ